MSAGPFVSWTLAGRLAGLIEEPWHRRTAPGSPFLLCGTPVPPVGLLRGCAIEVFETADLPTVKGVLARQVCRRCWAQGTSLEGTSLGG